MTCTALFSAVHLAVTFWYSFLYWLLEVSDFYARWILTQSISSTLVITIFNSTCTAWCSIEFFVCFFTFVTPGGFFGRNRNLCLLHSFSSFSSSLSGLFVCFSFPCFPLFCLLSIHLCKNKKCCSYLSRTILLNSSIGIWQSESFGCSWLLKGRTFFAVGDGAF